MELIDISLIHQTDKDIYRNYSREFPKEKIKNKIELQRAWTCTDHRADDGIVSD